MNLQKLKDWFNYQIKTKIKEIYYGKKTEWVRIFITPYVFDFSAVFVYSGLMLIKIFTGRTIKFVYIYCNRIGHLASETELFLRRLRNGIYDGNKNLYIGLCSDFPVSNRQLLDMYKRELFIIENRIMDKLIRSTRLRKSQFFHIPRLVYNSESEFNHIEYHELNNYKSILSFSGEEEKHGEKMLTEMGIGDKDWFVCFHARDNTYLAETDRRNEYRNCNIESFMQAAEYIAAEGGYTIRMGAKVEKPLPKDRHNRIIDYAIEYRSDFMDIYLSSHCKFFIASASGLYIVSTIFKVPVVVVNCGPFEYSPFREGDLFIPKLYYNQYEERFLSAPEILESGLGRRIIYDNWTRYSWLQLIDNTPEEIYEVVKEMNLRLDGKYSETPEDLEYQKKFRSHFKPKHIYYGSPAKIGAHFLKKYSPLLAEV